VIVVGMVSAYKEGRLVRAAIRSLRAVELDRLYIYEGPAGDALGDEVPDSEYGGYWAHELDDRIFTLAGRWRSDARKRDAMLQRAKAEFPGVPLWGVIVDGDEVLCNGEYLRDRLQTILWDDEAEGGAPTVRWPLRLIEQDGGISLITARVIRLDLVRSIDISSSVVTTVNGFQEGWGNTAELSAMWLEMWMSSIDKGRMVAWPPLPCEPCIVHRANLRHPARRRLRMSDAETRELELEKQRRGIA
jgi:hypothetical protein